MLGYYLVEGAGYWEIPLKGKRVSRFKIDTRLTFEFLEPSDQETRIEIEADFQLRINGTEYKLSAEDRMGLGPVFKLYGMTVDTAAAFKDGKLEIDFLEDAKLTVLPSPEFESWQIIGSRGLRVVCTGGGKIFTWQAEPQRVADDIH